MNVVYIAVFIVITAVSSLFAWIGPDEIRKSRMRNIEPAVDDGDDYFSTGDKTKCIKEEQLQKDR